MRSRGRGRECAVAVAVFAAASGALVAGEWWSNRSLSPGACKTIGCVARSKPAPLKLAEVRVDGRGYFVWQGEIKPLWLPASGPACYVFDERGELVTWASETGEGGEIERFVAAGRGAEPVSLEEVLGRVGRE